MTRMRRDGAAVVIDFDEAEAGVLGSLSRQLAEMLRSRAADPAMERLLPDAYPDDPEASAEFRRYTAGGLADGKADSAASVAEAVGSTSSDSAATTVRLEPDAAEGWLRTLTDLRLTVASRLGIRTDDDEPPGDEVGAIYQWLGELQWALIEVLDHEEEPDAAAAD